MRKSLMMLLAVLGALCGLSLSAMAQSGFGNTTGYVISGCGSPPTPFIAGNPGPFTLNTSGGLCISGTITANLSGALGNNADGVAVVTTGNIGSDSYNYIFNGTSWDRQRGDTTNGIWANIKGWASGALGAMANYGTSPGAVLVPGVNAFITNTPTVVPPAAALTTTAITVTNSSGTFLAASTATKYLTCKNESTTASIALNFANGTAQLNTAGNVTLLPGASITFDSGVVPTGAITGISSIASSPATCISS